ncbi:MAG: D-alanyl-D-alanine carboxypeptidase [Clostridia bacterium]|nr:D-alanyl-D-alanine carboxypeptidase [Clostridia bacterium]
MPKRFLSLILTVLTFMLCMAGAYVHAEETTEKIEPYEVTHANAAIVYNLENDRYIYEMDADEVIYPSSTVKLMTAILALEALGDDLTKEVTVPAGAVAYVQGNNIALKRDEVVTVKDLLYALIVGCANDAANVLAYEIAGGIDEFVVMMNAKAKELGAENTLYTNPTGMHHPAMVTTARDTAIIATYAAKIDLMMEISSVEKYVMNATNKEKQRTIFNKNYYFSSHMEYKYIWSIPLGLNAGYTVEGGYCIATTAVRDGLTYVVVVMGAQADEDYIYSYTEAANLIKWAFNAYGYTKLLTTADMICEMPVRLASKVDYVMLFPSQDVELYLPVDIDVSKDLKIDWVLDGDYFTAPVSEGAVGGHLTIEFDGQNLGTYDLITRNGVDRSNILYILDLLGGLIASTQFKAAILVVVLLIVAYVVVLIWMQYARRKRYRRRR